MIADEEIQLKILDVFGKWRSDDIDTLISYYQQNPYLWDSKLLLLSTIYYIIPLFSQSSRTTVEKKIPKL